MIFGLRVIACGALFATPIVACGSFGADETPPSPSMSSEGGPMAMPTGDGGPVSGDAAVKSDAIATEGDAGQGFGPVCVGLPACDRIVFVTAAKLSAQLIDVAGADQHCNTAAQASKIPELKARAFLAWISNSKGTSPNQRFVHGTGKYIRLDHKVVANNWNALTTQDLLQPIALDDQGGMTLGLVWTATDRTGVPSSDAANSSCLDWASADVGGLGTIGSSAATVAGWSNQGTTPCNEQGHLYCFEQ